MRAAVRCTGPMNEPARPPITPSRSRRPRALIVGFMALLRSAAPGHAAASTPVSRLCTPDAMTLRGDLVLSKSSLCKIVGRLEIDPKLRAATERPRQADRHLR